MQQTGPNEGVAGTGSGTALVTIDGVGSLFAVILDEFELGLAPTLIPNTGRGDDTGHKTFRLDDAGGSFTAQGRIKSDKRPMPKYLASAGGNVRLVQSSAADGDGNTTEVNFISFAALFTKITFAHAPPDEGGEDAWTVSFTATKTGPESQGWDNLNEEEETAIAAPPEFASKEILAGLAKSIDPKGITSSARRVVDLVGVANTDGDEVTRLAAVVADAAGSPSMDNLKPVSAQLTRTGTIGARVTVAMGLQDSQDNLETPRNTQTIDANSLRDARTLASVWDSGGSAPAAPAAPAGSKLVTYSDYKINDQKTLRLWVYGRQDSKDDVETPRNTQTVDANGLRDYRTQALMWNSGGGAPADPGAPAGSKLVTYTDYKLNDQKMLRVWVYGRQDSVDDVETPRNVSTVDANALRDGHTEALVWETGGSAPATPAAPSGLKLVTYTDQKLNDDLSVRVWTYARQDSKDDVETPLARALVDDGGIDDSWQRGQIYTGTPPTTPTDTPPAGLVLADWEDQKLNDARSLRVFRYARDNSAGRILNGLQRSTRSSIEAFTRTSVELLATTDTPETVMAIYWSTFQAESFAYRISVHKIHGGMAAIVKEYVDPGIGLRARIFGTDKPQPGKVSGSNVQVFIAEKLTRGSSSYFYRLGRSQRRRTARQFTLSRLLSGTTVPDFQSQVETTNNATFLGLSAGYVLYQGANVRSNIGLSGTYDFYMDYDFLWLSDGHFTLEGWAERVHATAAVSTGWQNVSGLTGSGLVASLPSQTDFSGFLA